MADPRLLIGTAAAASLVALLCTPTISAGGAGESKPQGEPFTESLAGTTVALELVPIPAGVLEVPDPAAAGGVRKVEIAPFHLCATEITWDVFDVFVFALDQPAAGAEDGVDSYARPTKPYLTVDRGFGHAGYPALSMSWKAADAFCAWLSGKTGRKYRMPTEDEWTYACLAGSAGPYSCGDDPAGLDAIAWWKGNSDKKPHPVGSKRPNAYGLYDMHGNVMEWALGRDGVPLACGGSFREDEKGVRADARKKEVPGWNATDPQIPKSTWWRSDTPWLGFRVVCEAGAPVPAAK